MHQYVYVSSTYDDLLIKEVDEKGNRITKKIDTFMPTLYIPKKTGTFKSTTGVLLEPYTCNNIAEMRRYIKESKEIAGSVGLFGMRNAEYQYIQDNFSHRDGFDVSVPNVMYFDIETERSAIYGYAPPSNPFNSVILITTYVPKTGEKVVFALNNKPHVNLEGVEYLSFPSEYKMLVAFMQYMKKNDIDVVSGWNIKNYDIPFICGRLLGQYKHPGDKTLGNFEPDKKAWRTNLAPFDVIKRVIEYDQWGNVETTYEIPGIEIMDYMLLYKKFTYKTRESYSLNHISYCELGDKKVDYSEYQHLQSLYENDYDKFVEYGMKDTVLVYRIDEKLKLMDLAITLAYIIGCNISDVFSPVKSWEVLLYNKMLEEGIVPPINKKSIGRGEQFMGAYVMSPVPGKYEWVISLDLNSLYPHIMMFCNMSPETHIPIYKMDEELHDIYVRFQQNKQGSIDDIINGTISLDFLKKRNICLAPNGAMFKRDTQGVLPKTVKWLYAERKKAKNEMLVLEQDLERNGSTKKLEGKIASLNAKQMSLKILMNSVYGATGNSHFLFYELDIAEGITAMGQTAIKYIGKEIEEYLEQIFGKSSLQSRLRYSDTDSIYVSLNDFVDKLKKSTKKDLTDNQIANALDKFVNEKIEPFIDNRYELLRDRLNGFEQSLKMKREKIAKSAIFVAKKRYTTAIIDEEGVRFEKIKVKTTGLESVRSSTPEVIRGKLRELEELLLVHTEDEVHTFLTKLKREFKTYNIQDIAIVKSVNEIEKWAIPGTEPYNTQTKVGTPLQVKAAVLYNNVMLQIDSNAETIKSGDKIHLVYIKRTQRFNNEHCIAYPQIIAPELGLISEIVDWDTMYEKTFLSAAQILMKAIGLEARKRVATSLDSFFS